MSVVIDLFIVAILVSCVIRHYKLGLACALLSFGKFIIALICASIFRAPLAALGTRLFVGEDGLGRMQTAIAGVISYMIIFAAVIAILSFAVQKLSKLKIPIITKFDKLLGVALGLVIGLFSVSLISSAAYTIIEFIWSITNSEWIMNVYSNSYVFKFIKDISLFEFIGSKF